MSSTETTLPMFTNTSEEDLGGRWGMVIDQDICTGCQACVAACAMENNIPFVGETDAAYGRSLHRSEEHTSELSHQKSSYAVFCLKKKNYALGFHSGSRLARACRHCQLL